MLLVDISNLGAFKCANVLFKGKLVGKTVTRAPDSAVSGENNITNGAILTGKTPMISVNFYPTNDCSGKAGKRFRATFVSASGLGVRYVCDGTKPAASMCIVD